MNRRRVIAFVVGVAAVSVLAPRAAVVSASAAAPILTVSPAQYDPTGPGGASYFVHDVPPGDSWSADVAVVNTTATSITAWVDPVDGITSIRTGAVYTARGAVPKGTALWITPSVSSITVGALDRASVGFSVHVPSDASAGDHVGGLAFETQGAAPAGTPASGGVAVTTVLRSVVAVQVVVPGLASFHLDVYGASVAAVTGTETSGVAVDMADVGGLLGKPHLVIALAGPSGYTRTEDFQLDTMLTGDRITDEFLWPDALPAGDYRVSVTEDGGGREGTTFTEQSHLGAALLPQTARPADPAIARSGGPSPIWLVIAAIVVCLLAFAAAAAVLRRRRGAA